MKKLLFVLVTLCIFTSCKKDKAAVPQPPPVVIDDARTVLLKSVTEQGLPPQYKFVYDTARYVTEINYADGFSIYNVGYENNRVKKLTNTFFHSYLLYHYNNGRVTKAEEFDSAHNKILECQLLYNTAGKLIELVRKSANGTIHKKEKLTYHTDGNLAAIEQYLLTNGTLKLIQTRQYSDYDTKINVDDFYKLHGFMETFLFLPQVKLQANNPGKEIIFSEVNTYEITYTYQFSNGFPVSKASEMKQTRGTGSGQVMRFTNNYTYY